MKHELDKQDLATAMQQAEPEDGVKLLAGLPAAAAYDLLLEHPDPEQIVELIPIENLYLMLHEIGVDDALILLELSTPEQVQGFIDIDCWEKDRLSLAKARTWMLLLNELEDEHFMRHLHAMDLALVVLFLRRHVELIKIENPNDEIVQDGAHFLSPDGRYLLQYTCSVEQSRLVNAILMRISRLDLEFFQYLLEAMYWEINSDLEETAYQERFMRMEDRGFPDYYASLEILATVDPDQYLPGKKLGPSEVSMQPGAELSSSTYLTLAERSDSLLRRALAEDFAGRDAVTVEILGVANMVAVAERVSFVDLERVRHIVARTDGFLNIGLQHLAGEGLVEAREALTSYRVVDLHKIGRSLVMRLARRARKILRRASVNGCEPDQLMLDGDERDLVYGLLQQGLSRHADGVEGLWTDLRQVRLAEQRMAVIESLVELMHDHLDFTPDIVSHLPLHRANIREQSELGYRVLFNTFFCHDWLGRKPAPTPLTRADLDALAGRLERGDDDPAIPEPRLAEFRRWLEATGVSHVAELEVVLGRYLRGLAADLDRTDLPAHLRHEMLTKP